MLAHRRRRPATPHTTLVLRQPDGAPSSSELLSRQPVLPTACQEPQCPGITSPISLLKARSLPEVTKESATDWSECPGYGPSHIHQKVTEALKSYLWDAISLTHWLRLPGSLEPNSCFARLPRSRGGLLRAPAILHGPCAVRRPANGPLFADHF